MLEVISVFLTAIVIDGIWAFYIRHTAECNVWKASISSSVIVVMSTYLTIECVSDYRMILPAATGGFLGTFFIISKEKKKKNDRLKTTV